MTCGHNTPLTKQPHFTFTTIYIHKFTHLCFMITRGLELRVKEIFKDLQMQKDQCDLMRDKAIQLEMNLKNTKRQQLENSAYQEKLADASQLYERKIADLVQEVEEEQARSTNAEHQLNEMKNVLSNQQKSC
ncbi:hypothetical protein F2Q69_00015203 [Brassica cretica]|uniref:Uncharacterized protein n=1 Tax=Brassica cretica TaxID=69181 RepID=A0A8S9R1E7_BRACR|nr:hypothetical protein F2Q69_00015203 [Brassica cretica]